MPEEILSRIENLPPMPAVASQLLEAMNDPDVDLTTVAQIIGRDPGITANLLKQVNSSYYGFSTEVTSIRQAASLLGLKRLANLAITVISSKFLTKGQPGYALEQGELFKHAVVAAHVAEMLAEKVGYRDPGAAFTAGLLHDIGKIVVAELIEKKKAQLDQKLTDATTAFNAAETAILGMDHAHVGALLMEKWNFPKRLVDAIRHHHDAGKAETDSTLAAITQLADSLTMVMGVGIGADGLKYNVADEVFALLGLRDPVMIEKIIAQITERLVANPEILQPPR